jgi:deoxyribonuclease-4
MKSLKSSILKNKFIGAHVSASGGVSNAPLNAAAIGADAFALFVKNQRQWYAKPPGTDEAEKFMALVKEKGFDFSMILAHNSYLVNPAHPDEEKLEKSLLAFVDEIKRCSFFNIEKLNFHPGSALNEKNREKALFRVSQTINRAHELTANVFPLVTLVIENTAGQGNTLGSSFEEIAAVIHGVKDKSRLGVCLDTAHLHAAGHDIRTFRAYEKVMNLFSDSVGMEYLMGMHLNDSKTELASRVDRHHSLGKGTIGMKAFECIIKDPRTDNMPLILETIDPALWALEINMLRNFAY